MESESPKTCFVIMPFTVKEPDRPRYTDANHWNEVYEGLIAPAVAAAGLACVRDDKDIGSRLIAEGVLEKLERADIVLCDLSSHNANVFLELGWALRADKPYVLIKDELTDFTFDLAQQFTFQYRHALQPVALRREVEGLAEALRRTLQDSARRYSLLSRLSLSLSTIRAVEAGDLQARIFSDLQQRIAEIQKSVGGAGRDQPAGFAWPDLLRRGTKLLAAVKEKLDAAGAPHSGDETAGLIEEVAKGHGAYRNREIQISLLDGKGYFVYHEWPRIIGKNISSVIPIRDIDFLGDIYGSPSGAVAWADTSSNLPRHSILAGYRRLNIGIFAPPEAKPAWRLFVETHMETE
ncbi:MAG TPA: hypothetical protein VGX48_00325 [Pyrinomonadaceae bacterium]|jgi:hypothetical protein|nr:hypothetical protein [Pyrinomonadaceae bacterium]